MELKVLCTGQSGARWKGAQDCGPGDTGCGRDTTSGGPAACSPLVQRIDAFAASHRAAANGVLSVARRSGQAPV
jgi:hypothetical protein